MKKGFPKRTSNYKLLISDFDGTIAGQDHSVSPKVRRAIKLWTDSGNLFTIASGRQFLMLKHEVEKLGLTTPLIVRGGAEIHDPVKDKVLYSQNIDKDTVKKLIEILLKNGLKVIIEHEDTLYCSYDFETTFKILKIKKIYEFKLHDVPKMIIRVENEESMSKSLTVMEQIKKGFPQLNVFQIMSPFGLNWDITSEKATKHLAVLELMKILKIKPKETVGVGDGYNDYPLLTAVGLKVAMGNANEELKELADIIVPSHEEHGVAFLINKLLSTNHES